MVISFTQRPPDLAGSIAEIDANNNDTAIRRPRSCQKTGHQLRSSRSEPEPLDPLHLFRPSTPAYAILSCNPGSAFRSIVPTIYLNILSYHDWHRLYHTDSQHQRLEIHKLNADQSPTLALRPSSDSSTPDDDHLPSLTKTYLHLRSNLRKCDVDLASGVEFLMCALSQDLATGRWTHGNLVNLLTRMLSVESKLSTETREGIGRALLGFVTAEPNQPRDLCCQETRDGAVQRDRVRGGGAVSDSDAHADMETRENDNEQSQPYTHTHTDAYAARPERQDGMRPPSKEDGSRFCRCHRCWWRPEWVERTVLQDLLSSAVAVAGQGGPRQG